jgi:putative ABC transport system permease protein
MLNDVRFAVRSFAKSPGFTLIAVMTLAVGIGASTAMFSALRVLVVQPFDYPDQDRVVQVWPNEDAAMGPLDIKALRFE